MSDVIEKPSCTVLYRQSSLETRLSPIDLSEEQDSDEEHQCEIINPKIVDVKYKTPPSDSKGDSGGKPIAKTNISKVKELASNLENTLNILQTKNNCGEKNNDIKNNTSGKPKIEPKPKNINAKFNLTDLDRNEKIENEDTAKNNKLTVGDHLENQAFKDKLKNELTQKINKPNKKMPEGPPKPRIYEESIEIDEEEINPAKLTDTSISEKDCESYSVGTLKGMSKK